MHPRVVEVVALESPGLDEHLPPLVARDDGQSPVAEVDLAFLEFLGLGLGRLGVEDVHSLGLAYEQFLCVGRELEAPHVSEDGFDLDLLARDRRALQRASPFTRRAIEPEQSLAVDLERTVVAGRDRHGLQSLGNPVHVDHDLDRLPSRVCCGVLLFFLLSSVRACGVGVVVLVALRRL